MDLEALKISALTRLNRNTVNNILMLLRKRLLELCEEESAFEKGVFECDESYFGARRVRGKRGHGAIGKTIVFGIYNRDTRRVYSAVVPNVKSKTLINIIDRKRSVIYTDRFKSYFPLLQNEYPDHQTVNHGRNEFISQSVLVNGIENFWSIAKVRMSKFRSIKPSSFSLHLKESEFRFNPRHDNLYQLLLTTLRNLSLN